MENYIIHFKHKDFMNCVYFHDNLTMLLQLANFPYKVICESEKNFVITYSGNKSVQELVNTYVKVG